MPTNKLDEILPRAVVLIPTYSGGAQSIVSADRHTKTREKKSIKI